MAMMNVQKLISATVIAIVFGAYSLFRNRMWMFKYFALTVQMAPSNRSSRMVLGAKIHVLNAYTIAISYHKLLHSNIKREKQKIEYTKHVFMLNIRHYLLFDVVTTAAIHFMLLETRDLLFANNIM